MLWSIMWPLWRPLYQKKKTAHIMMLWKYKLLNQDDALWP
jgi:hypothetical protein